MSTTSQMASFCCSYCYRQYVDHDSNGFFLLFVLLQTVCRPRIKWLLFVLRIVTDSMSTTYQMASFFVRIVTDNMSTTYQMASFCCSYCYRQYVDHESNGFFFCSYSYRQYVDHVSNGFFLLFVLLQTVCRPRVKWLLFLFVLLQTVCRPRLKWLLFFVRIVTDSMSTTSQMASFCSSYCYRQHVNHVSNGFFLLFVLLQTVCRPRIKWLLFVLRIVTDSMLTTSQMASFCSSYCY